MPAGLQVDSENGFIQIDGTYRNYHLITRSTANCTTPIGSQVSAGYYTDVVVNNVSNPLIAFYGNNYACAWVIAKTSSSTTFRVYKDGAAGIVEYIVFGLPYSIPSSGYGIQVFDETSALVFDSNYPYMRVIGVMNTNFENNTGDFSFTIQGKRLAAIQVLKSSWVEQIPTGVSDPEWMVFWYSSLLKSEGATVRIDSNIISGYGPSNIPATIVESGTRRAVTLIVDVTNDV